VTAVLIGDSIQLRLVREQDLDTLFELTTDLEARGAYFPLGLQSETALRSEFAQTGFWEREKGMLLMARGEEIVGEIEFFPISHYMQGYELSYMLFGSQHAGRGYTTEAVRLLSRYLFHGKRINRLQLIIHPGNEASKRVAVKCGYSFEGVLRQAWFNDGDFQDVEVWSLLREKASAPSGG
jgi:[ribosomal protein S5]-alanine N-acetyltransferase